MSEMSLPERHSRIRAHEDVNTVMAADQFVTTYFGGEYDRAAWFLSELALMEGGRNAGMYSVKTGTVRTFYPRSEKQHG